MEKAGNTAAEFWAIHHDSEMDICAAHPAWLGRGFRGKPEEGHHDRKPKRATQALGLFFGLLFQAVCQTGRGGALQRLRFVRRRQEEPQHEGGHHGQRQSPAEEALQQPGAEAPPRHGPDQKAPKALASCWGK